MIINLKEKKQYYILYKLDKRLFFNENKKEIKVAFDMPTYSYTYAYTYTIFFSF